MSGVQATFSRRHLRISDLRTMHLHMFHAYACVDQLHNQVICWLSHPCDTTAGERTDYGYRQTLAWGCAPPHFGHQGDL